MLSFAVITPAVIQNENHIYYQNAELRDYVKQYGIVMESWYPFGGRGHTQESFENDVILDLAKAHGKTAAQIILRWHLQDGYIAIPGSSDPDHIAENYRLCKRISGDPVVLWQSRCLLPLESEGNRLFENRPMDSLRETADSPGITSG